VQNFAPDAIKQTIFKKTKFGSTTFFRWVTNAITTRPRRRSSAGSATNNSSRTFRFIFAARVILFETTFVRIDVENFILFILSEWEQDTREARAWDLKIRRLLFLKFQANCWSNIRTICSNAHSNKMTARSTHVFQWYSFLRSFFDVIKFFVK